MQWFLKPEDIKISIFLQEFSKFAVGFNIFEYFCPWIQR